MVTVSVMDLLTNRPATSHSITLAILYKLIVQAGKSTPPWN
jgi:hypothetical protein